MKLGVVIPAYNAARTLPGVIARLPAELDLAHLWIVNDGSTDATLAVARELAARRPRVAVLDNERNRGYGATVRRGLAAARAHGVDAAACLHADGQYAPERLPDLVRALGDEGLDLVQGSRIASGTALSGRMPLYKFVANRVLTTMENRVFGLQLSDYHSGYLVYGRRALERVPFARLSASFDFDLEVIACACAQGLRIGERAIPTHYGDEISHLNPVTYGLRVLRVMARYRRGAYR